MKIPGEAVISADINKPAKAVQLRQPDGNLSSRARVESRWSNGQGADLAVPWQGMQPPWLS